MNTHYKHASSIILIFSLILFSGCVTENVDFEKLIQSYGPPEDYDWNERYPEVPTSDSRLHLYLPESPTNSPIPAVVILPGGTYQTHATVYEGICWVPFFLKLGYATAVLEYELPWSIPERSINHVNSIFDYLKSNSDINPDDIGIMGFSAGGHLASLISTLNPADKKPSFQILFYPVISMEDEDLSNDTHKTCRVNLIGTEPSTELKTKYSSQENVDSTTPPAFVAVGDGDLTINKENSFMYIDALAKNGIDYELQVAPYGDHGYVNWVNLTPIRKSLREWLTIRLNDNEDNEE